jgi:hypothetical protein
VTVRHWRAAGGEKWSESSDEHRVSLSTRFSVRLQLSFGDDPNNFARFDSWAARAAFATADRRSTRVDRRLTSA